MEKELSSLNVRKNLIYSEDINKFRTLINNQQLNEYVKHVIDKTLEANKYFNDEAPWDKKKAPKRVRTIIYVSLEIIRKISILLLPVIPHSATKALNSLSLDVKTLKLESIKDHFTIKSGSKLNYQGILFKKIEREND